MELEVLKADLVSLNNRHLTVSYLTLGVAALVFAVSGWWVIHTMQTYERLVTVAETRYEQYEKRMDEREKLWKEHDQQREALIGQQKVIERTIEYRDVKAAEAVKVVTAEKPVEAVAQDSSRYLGVLPMIDNGLLAFKPPEVQSFMATKIERDACLADLADTKTVLGMEEVKTASLQTDLAVAKEGFKEAEKTLGAYRTALKKTKWQRFIGIVKDAGKVAVGITIGFGVARAVTK